jgi:hypothetical protein
MSRDASITIPFADGDHTFRLAWGELSKLQEACDAGPFVIWSDLMNGSWRMEQISNVIRLGLIGCGKEPAEALKLVRAYVEDRPPMETLALAQGVLGAALQGAPDEKLGGAPAASETGTE